MFLIAILNCLRLAGNTILAGNRFHKETMRTGNACARALILASGYNSLRGVFPSRSTSCKLEKHVKRYINKTVNNFETHSQISTNTSKFQTLKPQYRQTVHYRTENAYPTIF